MIRQVVLAFAVAATVSAHAVTRPYPIEQYIRDNIPGWDAAGISHGVYQPFSEFVFMDGASDTCEGSYPFNPRMAAAGVTDCYDLRPPPECTFPVSTTGPSGQHPNCSQVYIIRPSDANWAAANNSQYRWVLQVPGSYEQSSRIVITADGVGPDTGEMRVYDCLTSTGDYDPMKYQVLRTGTADECHHGPIQFNDVQYIAWRSAYHEGTTKEWTNSVFDFVGNNTGKNYFVIVDNVDVYGGGQTVQGTGFRATYPIVAMTQGRFFGVQNFRFVDCVARRANDDIAIGIKGGGVSDFIGVNGEVTNCGHTVMIGEGGEGETFASEAGYIENVWIPPSDARFMDEVLNTYWRDRFASNARIPYGYSTGGEPPSYVKAAALAPGDIDNAFKCATGGPGSKYADSCPFECNEQRMIGSKTGARVAAGSQRHLVRRVFSWGGRSSRVDNQNSVNPGNRSAGCGASSGDDGNSGKVWMQNRGGGITYDLIFGQGPARPMNEIYFSSKNNLIADLVVTNSIFITTYEPWMDNEFLDDHPNYILHASSGTTNPGQLERVAVWGNTYAYQGYENAPAGKFSNNQWRGSGAAPLSLECSMIIDYPNNNEDSNVSVDYLALFGNAGDHNDITNRFPTTLTYSKAALVSYTHITRPWTIIQTGVLETKTWDNLLIQVGSPIAGIDACKYQNAPQ